MICSKCLGRISGSDIDAKKRMCERLGKPYEGPPKVCVECVMLTILSWDDEPTDEKTVAEGEKR